MSEQPVDPNEQDQHTVSPANGPAKKHGDELEEAVPDSVGQSARGAAEMHHEQ